MDNLRLLTRNLDDFKVQVTVQNKAGPCVSQYRVVHVCGGYNIQGIRGDYHINTTGGYLNWTCNCPDAQHRNPLRCKHVRMVKAALNEIWGKRLCRLVRLPDDS